MISALRKRKGTEDGEQRLHRLYTGRRSPLISSLIHPPSLLALRSGSPRPSYSNTFHPGSTPSMSLALTIPSASSSFSNGSVERSTDGARLANTSFSQSSYHSDIFDQAPPSYSDPPPSYASPNVLCTRAMTYDQTSRPPFERTAGNTLLGPASRVTSPDADWHERHQSARLGVDVDYQAFLSLRWPGFPTRHANGPVGTDFGTQTIAFTPLSPQCQTSTSSISSQDPRWPSICYECKKLVNQYQHVVYRSESAWLIHAWAIHPSDIPWVPCKCRWEGCDNGIIYYSSKKWINHAVSVHQKDVYCDYNDCEYGHGNQGGKAFGTPAEKNRHTKQKHDDPETCQQPYCTHAGKLNRTDKRNKHMIKYHGSFVCTVRSCLRGHIDGVNYGFATQVLLDKHVRENKHRQVGSLAGARA
ncbi:uncharacterized protein PAC_08343 [Phialocephala subalpina]|uniref:Uncharacterized protein n=1 Tax=Phialocephala subalpina TaxID=576137 RepID=A0A1L7X0A3_9HELO|nr:uncharacterized protein PAC_08343 [Phialocephala subalpina]